MFEKSAIPGFLLGTPNYEGCPEWGIWGGTWGIGPKAQIWNKLGKLKGKTVPWTSKMGYLGYQKRDFGGSRAKSGFGDTKNVQYGLQDKETGFWGYSRIWRFF